MEIKVDNYICTSCKVDKPFSEYTKSSVNKNGIRHQCKSCRSISSKAWRENNDERYRSKAKVWRDNNKEHRHKKQVAYCNANKEKINAQQRTLLTKFPERRKAYKRTYAKKHPERLTEVWARKKHVMKERSVAWANTKKIQLYYAASKAMDFFNPCSLHHVDHVLPLRGLSISGLHVENNLQILCATENIQKGNGAMDAGSGEQ